MKNPNGYGSVYKLSGKRRKPFGARVTVGWKIDEKTGKAKQLYENIGYYVSRQEAMIALGEYNKNPYDLDANKMTFEDVYNKWSKEKYPKFNHSNIRSYTAAYNRSSELQKIKFVDIRKAHMQSVIDDMDKSYSTKMKNKSLYNQLFKFAQENDLVTKDYSKFVEIGKNNSKSSREPFSSKEIKKLWEHVEKVEFIETILIMIYTGLRPGELIAIENENIDIEKRIMKGGMKTDAGKDRLIPINKKILPFIKKRMNKDNKYLIVNSTGNQMSYETYNRDRWKPFMKEFKMTHKPHDCRHTFATLMDNSEANKLSIKKIMGHASKDITDKIYTHKDIDELLKAIDLI